MRKLPTAVLAFAITGVLTLVLAGCGSSSSQRAASQTSATPPDVTAVVPAGTSTVAATAPAKHERKLADGLIIKDIKIGSGPRVTDGQTAIVLYTGMLMNGTVFDSSKLHGDQPFSFQLGAGQVIQGWDIGVEGMRVGGIRELIIPPSLAYGADSPAGSGIPDNSTLKFRVQLVGVR